MQLRSVHDGTHAEQGATCGCAHHPLVALQPAATGSRTRWGAALLPALACAFCPACLTTYAKLLSVFGVSIGVDAALHRQLLVVALATSIAISAGRAWKRRRVWPLAVAVLGSALVGVGHWLGEWHAAEWSGMLVLLVGAWAEHYRHRRVVAPARGALRHPRRGRGGS